MRLNLEMPEEFISAIRQAVREEVESTVARLLENSDQLMTIKDVAEFMQVSVSTVRQFMLLGLTYFQEGQVIRFLKSDVIAWVAKQNKATQ